MLWRRLGRGPSTLVNPSLEGVFSLVGWIENVTMGDKPYGHPRRRAVGYMVSCERGTSCLDPGGEGTYP
jgi:hypothetical protein